MKARITSLHSFSVNPETDEEKLIVESWYGKKWSISPCIVNAGLNHPTRFISLSFNIQKEA